MKPVKSNMDRENGGFLVKEMPFGNRHFQVLAGKFSGVYTKPLKGSGHLPTSWTPFVIVRFQ